MKANACTKAISPFKIKTIGNCIRVHSDGLNVHFTAVVNQHAVVVTTVSRLTNNEFDRWVRYGDFLKALRAFKTADISFRETRDGCLIIASEYATLELPPVPQPHCLTYGPRVTAGVPESETNRGGVAFDGAWFKPLLQTHLVYAGTDYVRSNIYGINFHSNGDQLVVVSTNGHCLIRQEFAATSEQDFTVLPEYGARHSLILPTDVAELAVRFTDTKISTPVLLTFQDGIGVRLEQEGVFSINADFYSTQFPEYAPVLPNTEPYSKGVYDITSLATSLTMAKPHTNKHRRISMRFNGKLEIKAGDSFLTEFVPTVMPEVGKIDTLYFNVDYLLNALKTYGKDGEISHHFDHDNGRTSPTVFRSDDRVNKADDTLVVVMPMNAG